MDKINFIDGSVEKQTETLKEFFGLSSEQTFQDIKADNESKAEPAQQ